MTTHPNNLTTSPAGLALIKKHEGFRANVYLCPAGKPTIGYGHMLTRSEIGVLKLVSKAQAEALLLQDCRIAEIFINANVRVVLNQNQFDALVSFAFNLGVGALDRSTLLRVLNTGKYREAARQFLRWDKFKNPRTGKLEVAKGLFNRRAEESALFLKAVS